MTDVLEIQKHVKFLIRHLNVYPDAYSSLDSNRLTLLFFAISGLDLLGHLDGLLTEKRRQDIIDWIYSLQLTDNSGSRCGGFRGSLGCTDAQGGSDSHGFDAANLAQTYSGLLSLAILKDDFKRIDRQALLDGVKKSQKEDGSFFSQGVGSESDMRFVFCAVAICHILGDDTAIDWTRLARFIRGSLSFDGGIGQSPGDESHGGSTYCAVAALSLANRLWDGSVLSTKEVDRLVKWAVWKQDRGFHGRAHKPDDSCYAFWIGATLEILNSHVLIDHDSLRKFLVVAQHNHIGGFCKLIEPGTYSDILHTYFSLAALSLLHEPSFSPINASINVSRRSYEHILRSKTALGESAKE